MPTPSPSQPVSGPGQFSQRTDLSPGQPIRVPTGLDYGKAKQVEQAQAAVPLPAQPGGAPPPAGAPGPAPSPQPNPQPLGPAPGGGIAPKNPNILDIIGSHPTDRPNEPVTTPLPGTPPTSSQTLGTLLTALAQNPRATKEVKNLAAFVNRGRL